MGIFRQTDHSNQNIQVKGEDELAPANKDEQSVNCDCYRAVTIYLGLLCFLLAIVLCLQAFYSLQVTVVFKSQMNEHEGRLRKLSGQCEALNRSYTNLFLKYPELNQYCSTNKSTNLRTCKPCPEGWEPFKDKCYLFVPDRKDWLSSQYSCLSVGSHLALIQNEEEQKFLCRKADDFSQGDSYWLGLTNMNPERTWLWADGTPVENRKQFWDQPLASVKESNLCARLTPDGLYLNNWYPFSCKNSLKRICERRKSSVMF